MIQMLIPDKDCRLFNNWHIPREFDDRFVTCLLLPVKNDPLLANRNSLYY